MVLLKMTAGNDPFLPLSRCISLTFKTYFSAFVLLHLWYIAILPLTGKGWGGDGGESLSGNVGGAGRVTIFGFQFSQKCSTLSWHLVCFNYVRGNPVFFVIVISFDITTYKGIWNRINAHLDLVFLGRGGGGLTFFLSTDSGGHQQDEGD